MPIPRSFSSRASVGSTALGRLRFNRREGWTAGDPWTRSLRVHIDARADATQATGSGQSACPTVAELARKITAGPACNGGPAADQAATIMGPLTRIRGELSC